MFDMSNFNIILGMNFLSWYRVEIDYRKKKVQFHLDDGEELTFGESCMLNIMIRSVKVRKMSSKGCMGYLVHVVNKSNEIDMSFQSITIV